MTPSQTLDRVLKILAPKQNNHVISYRYLDVESIIRTSFDFTDDQANIISYQLPQILEKLVKDGNAVRDIDREEIQGYGPTGHKYYMITFEGQLLLQHGGYVQKFKTDETEAWLNEKLKKTTIDANVSVSSVNKLFWATMTLAAISTVATILTFVNDTQKRSLEKQLLKTEDSLKLFKNLDTGILKHSDNQTGN